MIKMDVFLEASYFREAGIRIKKKESKKWIAHRIKGQHMTSFSFYHYR